MEVLDDIVLSPADFVDAWAVHERNAAHLALAAHRLDASGEWALDGSVSITAWLRSHCRMSNRDAHALVHRGRFLATFTAIADAACDGVLSAGHVAALKAACPTAVQSVMHEHQAELVAIVAPLSVADAETATRAWRSQAEAVVDTPEPVEPDRELSTSQTTDGLIGRFVLDEAGATEFTTALRIASSWDGKDDTRSQPRRSADAFVDICAFFNANHTRNDTPRHRPHIELHTQADTLATTPVAWTDDGTFLYQATTDAYLCDSVINRVMHAGDTVLSYGRSTRTVPTSLWRAVACRDRGCRFPGCDRPISWCDAHHIRYWRHQGPTEYWNLTMLCSRHHHLVHRPGWQLKLLPDATLEVTRPDGNTMTSKPHLNPANGP
jgi:hypothetical protein